MFTLKAVGSNQTVVYFTPDRFVFFSYSTPVAAYLDGSYYISEEKFSNTTSRHINQWLGSQKKSSNIVPQKFFENLLAGVEFTLFKNMETW